MGESKKLIYGDSPVFTLASNQFVNVPVVLQYGDIPLIETSVTEDAGFDATFSIYHEDGAYLAKVKGTQIYLTEDGRKLGVTLRHPDRMTVCELGSRTIFEVRREKAAALKASAELYTPTGLFIRASGDYLAAAQGDGNKVLNFGLGDWLFVVKDLTVMDASVGLHYTEGDSLVIGRGGVVAQEWTEMGRLDLPGESRVPRFIQIPFDPESGFHVCDPIEVKYRPDPAGSNLLMSLYAKVADVVTELEQERGAFDVFRLECFESRPDIYDVIVLADWVSRDAMPALAFIKQRFEERLSDPERAHIGKYETVRSPEELRSFRTRFAPDLDVIPKGFMSRGGKDPANSPIFLVFRCVAPV